MRAAVATSASTRGRQRGQVIDVFVDDDIVDGGDSQDWRWRDPIGMGVRSGASWRGGDAW